MGNVVTTAKADLVKIDHDWKFKKEVSLPTLAAFAIHTGTVIWFVATLNSEVQTIKGQTASYAPQTEKIIKLEANMENIKDTLGEIKGLIRINTSPSRKLGLN